MGYHLNNGTVLELERYSINEIIKEDFCFFDISDSVFIGMRILYRERSIYL